MDGFLTLYDRADRFGRGAAKSGRLSADGFARLPRAFSAARCRDAATEVLAALESGRRLLGREDAPALTPAVSGLSFQLNRRRGGYSRVFWLDPGRAPEPVRRVALDPRFSRAVSDYYGGAPVRCEKIMGEELVPAPRGDRWHMDSITDQFKAMVLLSPVGPRNGPMRYLAGTHRRPRALDRRYERILARGYAAEAYPPKSELERLAAPVRRGVGRRGDALLFDTIGVHSGTPCETGSRLILTAYFSADTPKNRMLFSLRRPHDI
jgi:hypothetical protein